MEAEHSARQVRLAALRQQTKGESSSSGAASTSSLHPFRRAISNVTTRRQRRQAQQQRVDGDEDDDDEEEEEEEDAPPAAKSEKAMQRLAESTTEGQLLRRFRNWDPRTGEARKGDWTTITGIEEETANLESLTLEADATTRAAELQLSSLAPRKPNWDLRQRLDKRLKKLERRDKEARLILIRQRVKAASAGKADGKGDAAAAAEVATLGALAGYGGDDGESDDDDE